MSILAHRVESPAPRLRERRPVGRGVRRVGLGLFFASIAVNAALGIYAVLAPDFGETQGKILGTSLCVSGAVLLGLAYEPAWERRLLGPVPALGAALGALGFALAVVLIWAEPEGDTLGKVMGTVLVLSSAGVIASLLALSRLTPRHAWVFTTTLGLLVAGAAMSSVLPWLSDPGEWYLRSFGVVMIALAAFVVTVPVLHWVDRGALAAAETSSGAIRFCPYCGEELTSEVGVETSCDRCGREFTVRERAST